MEPAVADKTELTAEEMYEDIMAGFEELQEYAKGKRELRVTTRSADTAPVSSDEYWVIFEPGPLGWAARVPDLPGCIGFGATAEEAEASVADAMRRYVEAAKEAQSEPPPSRTQARIVSLVPPKIITAQKL